MKPVSARMQKMIFCLYNFMPIVWADSRNSSPENRDWQAVQTLSHFQISFSVFPKYHLLEYMFFSPFSWTCFLVLLFLSIQHKFSNFGTCHFDNWGQKETGSTLLALYYSPHDTLSSDMFTVRDSIWVVIYCKSEIKMYLITKHGWAYLRVSSTPDMRGIGLCLFHSNLQGPGPARGNVLCSGIIFLSGHILNSMWQMSPP